MMKKDTLVMKLHSVLSALRLHLLVLPLGLPMLLLAYLRNRGGF